MPLDFMPTARTVTSTLHYLQRSADKPARYVSEPPPGVPRWNGIDDPHEVSGSRTRVAMRQISPSTRMVSR